MDFLIGNLQTGFFLDGDDFGKKPLIVRRSPSDSVIGSSFFALRASSKTAQRGQ